MIVKKNLNPIRQPRKFCTRIESAIKTPFPAPSPFASSNIVRREILLSTQEPNEEQIMGLSHKLMS